MTNETKKQPIRRRWVFLFILMSIQILSQWGEIGQLQRTNERQSENLKEFREYKLYGKR